MPEFLSIAQAAKRLGIRPRDLSDAIYQGRLTDAHFVVIAGRKTFAVDRLPVVAQVIKRAIR